MTQTFAVRYGAFRPLLSAVGMGPGLSRVTLADDRVAVRMGWAFRASIATGAVAAARIDTGMVGGIGVHGWRGRWLVNGAASGLVVLDIEPAARAWAVGFPVRLRRLRISVEDPAGLVAALSR